MNLNHLKFRANFSVLLFFFLVFNINAQSEGIFFNGKSYVLVGNNLFDKLQKGTIEARIKIDDFSTGTIFEVGSSSDNTRHFRLYTSKGKLHIQNRYNQCSVESTSKLEKGKFYDIAFSSDNTNWKLYVNGNLEKLKATGLDNCPNNGNPGSWFGDVLSPDEINEYHIGVLKRPKGKQHYFKGDISFFKLWNYSLTEAEIKMNIKKPSLKKEKGLLVSYDFDNYKDNILLDVSESSMDGILYGFQLKKISEKEKSSNTSANSFLTDYQNLIITLIVFLIVGIFFSVKKIRYYITRTIFNEVVLPKNYIKGFDGLRGVSILLVLINHLGWLSFIPNTSFNKRVIQLVSGTTGVNIFFAISGFLITSILLAELEKKGTVNFRNFFARRFLRLLPPLLVFYSAIILLMNLDYLNSDFTALALSFLYIYNFVPRAAHYTPELGATWSLAVEEQFYLIWPFILNFFKRTKTRIYIVIFIISVSVFIVYGINFIEYEYEIAGKVYTSLSKGFFVKRWFFPAVAPIMVGAAFGVLLHKNKLKYKTFFEKNYLILLLALLLFGSALFLSRDLLKIAFIIQAIGVSFILLWIYFNQSSRITKILEFKPLAFIGKISYGLYVYQGLFLGTGPAAQMEIQEYPLNIILTFLIAIISYFFIEKPFMRLKKKFQ